MTLKELSSVRFMTTEAEAIAQEIIQLESLLSTAQDLQKAVLRALIKRMEDQIRKLQERAERIQNAVVERVTDEEILRMIELFQQGEDWTSINKKIYGYADYQACRKRTERAVKDITF